MVKLKKTTIRWPFLVLMFKQKCLGGYLGGIKIIKTIKCKYVINFSYYKYPF